MSTMESNEAGENLEEEVFSAVRLETEFRASASSNNLLWLLVVSLLFLLSSIADIVLFPERAQELVIARVVAVSLAIIGYRLFRIGKLSIFVTTLIPMVLYGIHFGFLFWNAPVDQLQLMACLSSGFLVAGSLVLVLRWHHFLLIAVAAIISTITFVNLSTTYTHETWFLSGGALIFAGGLMSVLAGHLRFRSHQKITKSQLALETSSGLLDEKNLLLREANQRLEEKVTTRTASLRKSNEERDAVVYRLSHDFKNPMINVRSLAEMAQREKDPAKLKRIFLMIDDSLNRFEGLVNGMDQFVIYSREEPLLETFGLRRLIVKNWERMLKELHTEMGFALEDGAEIQVESDMEKLSLVLKAIMRNAILFQAPDQASKLVVSIQETENETVISLRDNGPGIPQDVLHKVTDLFYRGDRRSKGLGIGLYLAKFTLEQIHGRLDISSDKNGTEVTFLL